MGRSRLLHTAGGRYDPHAGSLRISKHGADMKLRSTTIATATCLALGGLLTAPGSPATVGARQTQSVWNGIYTVDQAERGRPIYETACAGCHGANLTGGDEAPVLAGGEFVWTWNGLTVGALFERIRKSMPVDDPGSVSRQEKADILAFLFSVNEFPAGESELASRTSTLEQILFEAIQQ